MRFNDTSRAILLMLLAMAFITAGASLAKTLFTIIGVEATIGLRLGFAALCLFMVFRPWRHMPKGREWRTLLAYGVAMGGMNTLFYMAIARIPLGVGLALEFIGPLAVALFASRSRKDLLWVACALGGIALLVPRGGGMPGSLDPLGMVLALSAGAFWAAYILVGKHAGVNMHGGRTVAWGMLFASCIAMPLAVGASDGAGITPVVLLLALGVAVLSSAIPYSLEIIALKHLPTKTFSILTSLEPSIGAMTAYLFLAERLSAGQWMAIGLVLMASAGSSYFATRQTEH